MSAMAAPHPLNRNLFIADNLSLLRRLDNESIDLVCIDPPFAKNETWKGTLKPPLTKAELANERAMLRDWGIRNATDADAAGVVWPDGVDSRYSDIWRWDKDVHEDWIAKMNSDWPALSKAIEATRSAHDEGHAAYLAYMTIRVIELHRVLKPTGSLYLHCDHDANAYLRMMLDAIFGWRNRIAEVVWNYGTPSGGRASGKKPVKSHDTIFGYAKNYGRHAYNRTYLPYGSDYVEKWFRHEDEDGRKYRTRSRKGEIVKQYLDESPGSPLSDTWTDIRQLYGSAGWFPTTQKEITGYPTQKPVALAERIVKASTNPGDVVLDCFAGCAYVPVAAERNGRQWIACDVSPRALTVLRRQFAKFRYSVNGEAQGESPALIAAADVTLRSPSDLPERADEDPVPAQDIKPLPERRYKVPASKIPEPIMKRFLLESLGYNCWGCGFNPPQNDERYFQLDHRESRWSSGSNELPNRAILCQPCNLEKQHKMTLQELRDRNTTLGRNYGPLVNLAKASAAAQAEYDRRVAQSYQSALAEG